MNKIDTVNDITKRRAELIRQLEALTIERGKRETYISRQLNRRIHKLETQIHAITIIHREEIKKYYSGSKTTTK
jgi:hypothetical protein